MKMNKVRSQSRTTQVDTVSKQIIEAYKKSVNGEDQHLAPLMITLVDLTEEMAIALAKKVTENTLEEGDTKRDSAAQGVYHLLKGFLYHPAPKVVNAAQKLLDLFGDTGIDLIRESYSVESSLLDTLIAKLTDESMAEFVTVLPGISQLITDLVEAQEEFSVALVEYETNKGAAKTVLNASSVKRKILMQINNKIVIYLRAMAVVAEDQFGDFCRTVSEIIDTHNRVV